MTEPIGEDDETSALPVLPVSEPVPRLAEGGPTVSGPVGPPDLRRPVHPPRPRGRHGRAGSVVGRVVRLGALLAVGIVVLLTVGRPFVFREQWTAEIAPLVDELQDRYAVEFAESREVVELPPERYGTAVADHLLGPGWADRLPEWRALGFVGGRVSRSDVGALLAARYPAHYDHDERRIVMSRDVAPVDRTGAVRLALRVALAAERAGDARPAGGLVALTGLDRLDALAWWSIDEAAAGPGFEWFGEPDRVPVPVAYVIRALDRFGRAIVDEPGAVVPGAAPSALVGRLADRAVAAMPPTLTAGDRLLLDPMPLGADDWLLVWGTRLDPRSAAAMADSIAADSYSVVDRGGRTCFVAAIEGVDAAAFDVLLAGLVEWALAAPPGTAVVVPVDETRAQLEACDPGVVALPPPLTIVEVVIARQSARLAG